MKKKTFKTLNGETQEYDVWKMTDAKAMKNRKEKTFKTLNSVYVFHNINHNLHLFINAHTFDEAMNQFDLCSFKDRSSWKIFLECGVQPINSPKGTK